MIPIYTVTKNRPDLVCLLYTALKATLVEPHSFSVIYDGIEPECGEAKIPAHIVGISMEPNVPRPATPVTIRIMPQYGTRVFIEEDIIPIRPWSIDQYPGERVYLEGVPNVPWRAFTLARDGGRIGAIFGRPFYMLKQYYARDLGCPDWIPEELRELVVAANAKIAGDHFIHIDKVRQNTEDHAAKYALISALIDWFAGRTFPQTDTTQPAINYVGPILIKADPIPALHASRCIRVSNWR